MVSQAIDEGLVSRIQNYVANDINSKFPIDDTRGRHVLPKDISVVYFVRVLENWKAYATTSAVPGIGRYELIHDGSLNKTLVNVFPEPTTQQAIV